MNEKEGREMVAIVGWLAGFAPTVWTLSSVCAVHGAAGWYATKPDGFCHRAVRRKNEADRQRAPRGGVQA